MRTFLFILALTGALAGTAVPATAKHGTKDHAKPTGERCIQRAQAHDLSPTATAAATAACTKYAATVADARAALDAARQTYRAQRTTARAQFRAARDAALTQAADQRAAALKAAHEARHAAMRSARQALKAARTTYHAAVKAAKSALRAELRAARTG
ncbi:MAG: hypothetical protein QOG42_577 [Solirubrobacteraceae bacterium]|jgi:hypothetical protein|nr:hypothetical protein [Solirubrobacteraceae bacterium]